MITDSGAASPAAETPGKRCRGSVRVIRIPADITTGFSPGPLGHDQPFVLRNLWLASHKPVLNRGRYCFQLLPPGLANWKMVLFLGYQRYDCNSSRLSRGSFDPEPWWAGRGRIRADRSSPRESITGPASEESCRTPAASSEFIGQLTVDSHVVNPTAREARLLAHK